MNRLPLRIVSPQQGRLSLAHTLTLPRPPRLGMCENAQGLGFVGVEPRPPRLGMCGSFPRTILPASA